MTYRQFDITDITTPLLICGNIKIRMFHKSVFSTRSELMRRIDQYWREEKQLHRPTDLGAALRTITEDEQILSDRDNQDAAMNRYYENIHWFAEERRQEE